MIVLFVGEEILKLIGIDVASFCSLRVRLPFFLALSIGNSIYKDEEASSASIVPLAFP
jgi:multiple antibiotic resistance protein